MVKSRITELYSCMHCKRYGVGNFSSNTIIPVESILKHRGPDKRTLG